MANENNENRDDAKESMESIEDYGQTVLEHSGDGSRIFLLNIIGEIEGHEASPGGMKTTQYDHVLPQLARISDDARVDGVLLILNTVGGDVSCGLALAEMIATIGKPTVSLIIGDSHSIGVPIAVATDYAFIVPSATMIIHPVRMNGTVIGAQQTYDYFKILQERILNFIAAHSQASKDRLEFLMMNTGVLTKDLGTILVGKAAVREGLVHEVGGMREALAKLHAMIREAKT
ncbi:MAG: ATP-dependent Clp protease proteolytic subunit [Lachnospiraceae bacterium]|nr:ATP-dependent Clp protease proteolytic subunit [Lachnospiraceae bacterium]